MNSEILLSFLIMIPTWVLLIPIGICSILLLAVFIERVVFYHLATRQFSGPIPELRVKINSLKAEERIQMVDISDVFVKKLFRDACEHRKGLDREKAVEKATLLLFRKTERFLGLVSTISTVSPMLGLLGTVTGMMKSFSALSSVETQAQSMLAYGIAEALVTTATGLLVAIPAVILYNYMVSRSGILVQELEETANSLLDL